MDLMILSIKKYSEFLKNLNTSICKMCIYYMYSIFIENIYNKKRFPLISTYLSIYYTYDKHFMRLLDIDFE